MSSLEEPLGIESLPKLSIGRLQRCASAGYRPKIDEAEVDKCLIESRDCSSSSNCK